MNDIQSEFSRSIGRLITHLNRLRKRFMAKRLGQYNLSGAMYMFMTALDRTPGASQDYLVERFFMDKGNVARGAKKLEDLGYIRREVDKNDRRQYNLFLTDAGAELVPVIRAHLLEWSQMVSNGLTDDERKIALELLEHMVQNGNDALGNK